MKMISIAVMALIALFCCNEAFADNAVIKANIRDINGKPVAGVKLFLYESTNVRKPADFISVPSDELGRTSISAPKAKYWAVARLKKDALYGPLMPGDKHSGEPVEIDCSNAGDTEMEFIVADILEVGQKKRTGNSDTLKLRGRILDKDGNPVAKAYAFAHSTKEIEFIPEHLSAWTDNNGDYTLYLPSGNSFFVGSTRQFPPPSAPARLKEFTPETMKLDIATDLQLIVY
jgi:hypothetical protein